MEEETRFSERLVLYFLAIIIISCLFELGILIYGYINADKVECNLLWCTFTDVRSSSYKSFTETYSECYVNGEKVNCTEYAKEFPDYARHGWNEIGGICPGWKENKTISECIEMAKKEVSGNSSQP